MKEEIRSIYAPEKEYYIGKEVSVRHYHKTSWDVTAIRRIGDEIWIFVWHNGQETLFDRVLLDDMTYMEGRNHDPIIH